MRSLWAKFLLLLIAVSAIALSGAVVLRNLMVRDFRAHLEAEAADRILWLAASFENSYATHGGWEPQEIMDGIVWGAMMGLDIRIYDSGRHLISDTEAAFNSLSPPVKRRVLAFYGKRRREAGGAYRSDPLRLGGVTFGFLESRVLPPRKEALFIGRSNRFLLLSTLVMGGVAVVLSIVFSRRLTRPIRELTEAAARIAGGDLESRVRRTGADELGVLAGTFNQMAGKLRLQETLRRRLTANVAHELRTPLGAIQCEIEGMLDGLIPTERASLQSLADEISRLKKILEAIEDLSRAEASGLDLEKQDLPLAAFLRAVADRQAQAFAEKGVTLGSSCPESLRLRADPDRLNQILVNLLTNALRATESGGGVTLEARPAGDAVEILCRDTGRGIPEAERPHVFERFYRGEGGGLGLGLAIVRELVEAHGGRVGVESREGRGSTFRLRFPAG